MCRKYLHAESIKPATENCKFWYRNGENWAKILLLHLSQEHQEFSLKVKNFKEEWGNHFEKENISIAPREKDPKIELGIIAQSPCKLCGYQATPPKSKGTGNKKVLQHYCLEHFSEPLQYFVQEYIDGKHCNKCDKEYYFGSNTEKLFHVGYAHGELYPFLRSDSNIDLTPYIDKEEIVKEDKCFPCQECGTEFKQRSRLKNHLIYHSDYRPFPCPQCGADFKTKSSLKVHELTHTGEKPFSCDECKKAFGHTHLLKKHKETQHKNEDSPCEKCDEQFMTKYDLSVHMEYHYAQLPFKCHQCKMGHSNLRDFTRHKTTHRERHNHICNICNQSFKDGLKLEGHLALHETPLN